MLCCANDSEASTIMRLKRYRSIERSLKEGTIAIMGAANSIKSVDQSILEVLRSLEEVYLTPAERVRLLSSVAGLSTTVLGVISSNPLFILGLSRTVLGLINMSRLGLRVKASREVYIKFYELSSEIA